MKLITTYGFKCLKKDEKKLVQRINEYLKMLDRTMSKAKSKSMLEARLPFILKHFYWNLNKGVGTWFEIFPNEDQDGKYYSEIHKDCGWLLVARIDQTHPMYEKHKTEKFLSDVLNSTGFEYVIIEEKDEE